MTALALQIQDPDEDEEDDEAVASPKAPAGLARGPPCEGVLTVTLVECCNLIAADRNGFSDPYVTISVGGEKLQTSTTR